MTKIVIDRKTVEQALEALDVYYSKAEHRRTKDDESKASEAITALRTALAPPTCNHQWLSSGMHSSHARCIVCGKVKDRPEWGIGHAEQRRVFEWQGERKIAEHEYITTAFNYPEAPIGSRDWTLFWQGWQAALNAAPTPTKFQLGDKVRKTKGSQWHGKVVGTYSTTLTPEGYAVESSTEIGSVQIYPAAALEDIDD